MCTTVRTIGDVSVSISTIRLGAEDKSAYGDGRRRVEVEDGVDVGTRGEDRGVYAELREVQRQASRAAIGHAHGALVEALAARRERHLLQRARRHLLQHEAERVHEQRRLLRLLLLRLRLGGGRRRRRLSCRVARLLRRLLLTRSRWLLACSRSRSRSRRLRGSNQTRLQSTY